MRTYVKSMSNVRARRRNWKSTKRTVEEKNNDTTINFDPAVTETLLIHYLSVLFIWTNLILSFEMNATDYWFLLLNF